MAINSVRTALQLLSGAGDITRAKALEAAGTLLELPGVGETSARAGQLAEELIEAATANQAMVSDLVRTEVDNRLAFLGLARGSDLDAAQRKIEALEREVAELRERVGGDGVSRTGAAATEPSVKRTTPAKQAAAKTTAPAKKTAAPKKAAKKTAPAKKAAKKTAATKKTAGTKKAAATKKTTTAAKKTSTRTS